MKPANFCIVAGLGGCRDTARGTTTTESAHPYPHPEPARGLNAFNEALYDATAEALLTAASDPDVAVVLLTGIGAILGYADLTFMSSTARLKCPHQPGRHAGSSVVVSAPAVGGLAERRLTVDDVGVGKRRRCAADGAWSGRCVSHRI